MLVFKLRYDQLQTRISFAKGNKHEKKKATVLQSARKTFDVRCRNRPRINENPAQSPGCPPGCQNSPQKTEINAFGIPNTSLGHNKMAASASEVNFF